MSHRFLTASRLVLLVGMAARLVLPLAAQQPAPAVTQASGVVRTAGGVAVPGATFRLIETASGRVWMTWTGENGRFTLPGLPPGRYRVEISQLGFDDFSGEYDLPMPGAASLNLTLRVASLEALEPARLPQDVPEATEAAPPQPDVSATAAGSPAGAPQPEVAPGRGPRGTRGPGPGVASPPGAPGAGPGRGGAGGRPGGFQRVDVNGQSPDSARNQETEPGQEDPGGNGNLAADADPLGQAASSDAFLISGTVGRAEIEGPTVAFADFGGPGGGMGGAGGIGIPGFGGAGGGFGGPGGGGAPMLNGMPMPTGGGPGGGRGPGGPAATPLWGMSRVARQRANRIRFSVYNDYANSAFNARPYSLSGDTPEKIDSWDEGFGFSLGGPLRIPKVYDGSDRTFFFLNYDLDRGRSPVDQFATVPTAAERQGDFSERGVQLYDPFLSSTGPRTLWGSSIPSGVPLDSAALGLLQYIPEPNLPGLVQNFHLQDRVPSATDRVNVRIQHTISPRFRFEATYNIQQSGSHAFQSFPAFERDSSSRGQSFSLALTQYWSRTFIHDSRFFYTRNRNQGLNQFAFVQDVAGQLGINGVSAAPIDFGVPQLNFTNFTDASDPVPSLSRNQTFRYVDNFTIVRTRHNIRTGFEIRRTHVNTLSNPLPRGQFTFSGAMTSQLDAGGNPVLDTGLDFADFLLGLPAATNLRFGTPSTYFRSWTYAAYFNDDWRVRPDFTVSYGVRYEAVTPLSELYGHMANLDVNDDFTQAAVVVPGEAAPFSGALPPALVRGDYDNWSPRIGIAWRPPIRHAMTVRAGYSLMYNASGYNRFASSMASQPPWAQAQTNLSSSAQSLTLENGFPPAAPNELLNTIAIDPDYKLSSAQVWNLSVQTTLVRNMPFTLTYTGTKGSHLDLLLGFSGSSNVNLLTTGQSQPIQNAQGFTYNTSGANSIFHAVQARVQGRVTRAVRWGLTYTFGKSLDNASSIGGGQQIIAQDNGNLGAERGLSSFDVRHQFRANYSYELPFGERRRFARTGRAAAILGDWQVSGTLTMRSGSPFTARIFDSACQILPGVYSERADQLDDSSLDQSTPQQFFNTSAFAVPSGSCTGNAGRNTITGPGSFVMNLEISKNLRLGQDGQRRLEIRWEINNLTNTPSFTGLSTVVNSSTFGRVTGASSMRAMLIRTRVNF